MDLINKETNKDAIQAYTAANFEPHFYNLKSTCLSNL